MDGNGRWAQKKGADRIFGHQHAVTAVKEVTEGCAELKIPYLTLYAFSTENWGRPKKEVEGLMQLLVSTIKKEINTLIDNNVQLDAIGDIENLPLECKDELHEAIQSTQQNSGLKLTLALSYSGKWDITQALVKIVDDVESGKLNKKEISQELISEYLSTKGKPDPELLIRTSGEMRISNFLLWQLAYSEFYITETLWPDFRKEHLYDAILSYQNRERRFGKISEQINF